MRFYNNQHKYYCGIDLHTRKMYVCIIDEKGEIREHRKARSTITEILSLNKLPESIKSECRSANGYPRRLLVEIAKCETEDEMVLLFERAKKERFKSDHRTVFVDPETLKPFENQWDFLESIHRDEEGVLDEIIEINNLSPPNLIDQQPDSDKNSRLVCNTALPLCIQNMLQNGVSRFQRSLCFRLAVQLRRIGLPFDATVSVLKMWSLKNKPEDKKRIISDQEIIEQASGAYRKYYQAYGCEAPEMVPFCHPDCHLFAKQRNRGGLC